MADSFGITPKILQYDTLSAFLDDFKIEVGDLVLAYGGFDPAWVSAEATVLHYRDYGGGEPTDTVVEAIYQDIKGIFIRRVFGIGGGAILDIAKLFALKQVLPVVPLFNREREIVRDKELILIPTTCGTGSEVTNISILELTAIQSKFGLADDALYGDYGVLIPELLSGLPASVFATSSIDALIHALESYTSPKANAFTRLFSESAIRLILEGYQAILKGGEEERKRRIGDFMLASTYAGIAFGNAGCAAIHAMSYPLGATYHVPHGESNYRMFTGVYKLYQALAPEGAIRVLNDLLAKVLACPKEAVYDTIDTLLSRFIPKKTLREYGVQESELEVFTEAVITKQTRLLANNYVSLSREQILKLYQEMY